MSAFPLQQTRVSTFISFINSLVLRVLMALIRGTNINWSKWIGPRVLYCIYSRVFTRVPPWRKEMLEFAVGAAVSHALHAGKFPGMLRFHLGFISEGQYFKHERRRQRETNSPIHD